MLGQGLRDGHDRDVACLVRVHHARALSGDKDGRGVFRLESTMGGSIRCTDDERGSCGCR